MSVSTLALDLAMLLSGAVLAWITGAAVVYLLRNRASIVKSAALFFGVIFLALAAIITSFILAICASLWVVYLSFCLCCLLSGAAVFVISPPWEIGGASKVVTE